MQVVKSSKAPAAAGPYSQAVIAGGLVYVSGQLGVDLDTGEAITDWPKAVKAAFNYLGELLKASNSDFYAVKKLTVYVTDISKFSIVNDECAKRFDAPYPARSCVEVSALPKGSLIELECIARAHHV